MEIDREWSHSGIVTSSQTQVPATMELRFNELIVNEVLGMKNGQVFFALVIVKCMEKNHDITKPCCGKHILPVPWPSLYQGSTV